MEVRFDPNHEISYGYYICPACGSEFYGGGKAIHRSRECEGYQGCIYAFGPKESLDFAPRELHDQIREILEAEKQ